MTAFLALGFWHILSPSALDHLLFLLVLAAPYRFRDWRHLAAVASAFTVGHSVTLAMVASDTLRLPTALIEFLIPVTIVCAGLANLRQGRKRPAGWAGPLMAGGFGLIHGAGFANFLREMFSESVLLPLFSFNVGIELGQLAVLASSLLLLGGIDRLIGIPLPRAGRLPRTALASLGVAGWAALLAIQRAPW
jgi:HupE/UreJ protein